VNIKGLIALAGIVIALVVGGIFATGTFAQDDETPPAPGEQRPERPPHGGPCEGGPRGGPSPLLDAAAETLGLTVEELVDALDDNTSIADVASAQGIDAAEIVNAVLARAEERMQQAVENGRLTQEEADERLAQLREKVTERINEPGLPERPSQGGPRRGGPGSNGGEPAQPTSNNA
jgi:hypothetical protein